jgi:hypothetical protein
MPAPARLARVGWGSAGRPYEAIDGRYPPRYNLLTLCSLVTRSNPLHPPVRVAVRTYAAASSVATGKVVSVIGAVVDVQFEGGALLPPRSHALNPQCPPLDLSLPRARARSVHPSPA